MVEDIATAAGAARRLNLREAMRIEVIGEGESSNAQARTYAEYKVFAVLAQHAAHIRAARIVLRRGKRKGTCDTVCCAVTVALAPAGSVRSRACGPHVYAAINRTVDLLRELMRRRTV